MNPAVWVERHGRLRPDDPALADGERVHASWATFAAGRDAFNRLIAHESAGNDGTVDDILADLFGNPILTHAEIA